jgi:AbrB family looped-hinge helix DNA binding protein
MMSSITLHVAQRGLITIPKALREAYDIQPGDVLTLLDLGGVFVLTTKPSEVDALADRIAEELRDKGETLESMLYALREERERYGS